MSFAENGLVRVFTGPETREDTNPRDLVEMSAKISPHVRDVLESFARCCPDAWRGWTVAESFAPWSALGVRTSRVSRRDFFAWWGAEPILFAAIAMIAAAARRRVKFACVSVGPRRIVVVDRDAIWWFGPRGCAPVRALGDPDDRCALFRIRYGPAKDAQKTLRRSRSLIVARMSPRGSAGNAHAWHVRYDVLCSLPLVPATLEDVAVTHDVPRPVCEAVLTHSFRYVVMLSEESVDVVRGGPMRRRQRPSERAAHVVSVLTCRALRPALLEILR